MRTKLVTSRKWKNPEIEAFVSPEEVGARIDVEAFLDALVEEVGNPTTLLTKAGLRARLAAAKDTIVKELKDATKYVV